MNVCQTCGIPWDAGFFDASTIQVAPPEVGREIVLARYQLHRNYCGGPDQGGHTRLSVANPLQRPAP
jgi:hypothetical protein